MFAPVLGPEFFLPTFSISTIDTSSVAEIDLLVNVFPDWYREVSLEWTPPPSWESKEPRFNIYRSEIENGGFVKLNPVPVQETFFTDLSTTESSKHSNEYYLVEAILNDNTQWRSPVSFVGDRLPRWHSLRMREIQRREWIFLRKFAGVDATVLRSIRYNRHCPNCFDPVSRKLIKDRCTVCYGTGIEGGYYRGFRTKIQFDASTDSSIYTYFGKFEINQIGAWTLNIPNIEPFDVIIRHKDFKVFRVKDVSNTEIQNRTCRQIMRLEEQSKESVLYELIEREGLYG